MLYLGSKHLHIITLPISKYNIHQLQLQISLHLRLLLSQHYYYVYSLYIYIYDSQIRINLIQLYKRIMKQSNKYLRNMYCLAHPDQRLNLVCLNRDCVQNGLICHLCKSQEDEGNHHLRHAHLKDVIPIKIFMQSIEKDLYSHRNWQKQENQYEYIKMVGEYRDEMLGRMKEVVEQISCYIEAMEVRIMNEYQTKKSMIFGKHHLFRQSKKILEKATLHDIRKEDKFQIISGIKIMIQHFIFSKYHQNKEQYELDFSGKTIAANFYKEKESFNIICCQLEQKLKDFLKNYKDKNYMNQKASSIKHEDKKQKKQQIKISEEEMIKIQQKHDQEKYVQRQVVKIEECTKEQTLNEKIPKKQKKLNKLMKTYLALKKEEEQIQKIKQQSKVEQVQLKKNQIKKTKIKNKIIKQNSQVQETFVQTKQLEIINNIQQDFLEELKSKKYKSPFFSTLCKGASVKIKKNGKSATNSEQTLPSKGFAFVAQSIKKCHKLSLKIQALKGSIYVGICLSQLISQNKFQYKLKAQNHGTFMINNKGKCYIHNDSPKDVDFYFEEGDIINLIYSNKVLFFQSGNKKIQKFNPTIFKLDLKAFIYEEAGLHFGIFLEQNGDSVEII